MRSNALTPAGKDVIAQAQSGTGKTATFGISVLQQIDETNPNPQALILAPTRELAQQIRTVIAMLSENMKVTCHAFVGGTAVRDDIAKLQSGVQIVVGTPGRINDMINRNSLSAFAMPFTLLHHALIRRHLRHSRVRA